MNGWSEPTRMMRLGALGFAALAACHDPPCPAVVAAQIPPTLKYFGYFSSGQDNTPGVVRPSYQDGANIMRDVADQSNVVWIVDNEVPKLRLARELRVHAILYLYRMFFQDEWLPIDPARFTADWQAFAPRLAEFVADGTLVAIAPLDEPLAQVAGHAGDPASLSAQQMYQRLGDIATLIHGSFPSLPVMVDEQAAAITPAYAPPAGYDWIGFYCYGPSDVCNFGGRVEILKGKAVAGQKLFLITDANLLSSNPGDQNDGERARRLDDALAVARAEPLVVALLPFLWQSFSEGALHITGLSDMGAEVRRHFAEVGACVRSRD